MAIYDYSPTKVELQSLIQFFSGGRCNVTLGGGRSILLSYGCMCCQRTTNTFNKKHILSSLCKYVK